MRIPSVAALLLLPVLAGCWTHTPARPSAALKPEPIAAGVWPTRDPGSVQPILDSTPKEVFAYRLAEGVDATTLSESDHRRLDTPEYTITYKGIHANGLLRIYEAAEDDEIPVVINGKPGKFSFSSAMNNIILGFTPNARLMSSRTLDAAARHAALQAKITPPKKTTANLSVVASGLPAPKLEATGSARQLHIEDGLPLRIPPPVPDHKPRGLILHLHAIAGNHYEPQVIDEFERRGWAVIDIKTETSIESPIPESTHEEIRTLAAELEELNRKVYAPPDPEHPQKENWRETQKRIRAHPLYPRLQEAQKRFDKLRAGGFQARSEDDLPAIAKAIAAEADQALAGAAYATQAVLEYVKQERPDLQDIPVVLMGFSAGALAAPTAAARIHDQLDAVVLIGGGCDLFRISQGSVFTNGGIIILDGEEKAPKPTIDKIDKLYLEASRLDPYQTAPLIADLPILQLHASSDTWVPYETGEMLYERLNHPERLTISGGHEYLFYFLPDKKDWIADWVERTCAATQRAAR